MLVRDKAHVSVFFRDGASIAAIYEERDRLLTAFADGERFITVTGMYGQNVLVKLAEVSAISVLTQEQMDEYADELERERQADLLKPRNE